MKNFFLLTVAFSLLCACGGEEPVVKRPSYDPLVSLVESATSLESLAVIALCIEGSAADAAAIAYEGELPQEFVDSRTRFYAAVDERLAGFKQGHFVELRTVLYECAAKVCKEAAGEAELAAVKSMATRCSAALYIDGQRACDPPKKVREKYEEARGNVKSASLCK